MVIYSTKNPMISINKKLRRMNVVRIPGLTRSEAEKILDAPTPQDVVDIYNKKFELTSEQVEFYLQNGYLKVSNVLEGYTLEYARKVIQSAVLLRKEHDERALEDKSLYEQSFLQCGFLCWDYQPVKDYVFGKRFAGIARDLMKVNGVRLWHDQALFKEAGGRNTDVHVDSSYWPIAKPEMTTTIWLALVDVPEERGCLTFYPGSHKSKREYVDIFKNPHKPDTINGISKVAVSLHAGDATFHSGLVYHGAGSNNTDMMREAMTIIFLSDGNTFDAVDVRNATHKSCSGLKHGDPIKTQFTPILI